MLSTKEAAKYLGISPYYLRNMRHLLLNHDGPAYVEVLRPQGIACKYSVEELDKWKSTHKWRKDVVRSKRAKTSKKRSLMGGVKGVIKNVG
jgi:hypothetical protein